MIWLKFPHGDATASPNGTRPMQVRSAISGVDAPANATVAPADRHDQEGAGGALASRQKGMEGTILTHDLTRTCKLL